MFAQFWKAMWIPKMLSSSIGIGCFFKIRVEDDIFDENFKKILDQSFG